MLQLQSPSCAIHPARHPLGAPSALAVQQRCCKAPGQQHGAAATLRQQPPPERRRRHRTSVAPLAAGGGFGAPVKKTKTTCPCGSGVEYKDCCQPYHAGAALPQTPEHLMRSRYTAYVKGDWRYVVDTTHPLNPLLTDEAAAAGRPTLKDDVVATCDKLGFEKLKILEVAPGASEDEGYVRFQAWFKTRGQLGQRAQGSHTQSFIERSRFLRDGEGGRWLYVDGDQDWQKK